MSTSRLIGSLVFFSWILVLLLSSQCRKASTPSTGKAAEIFEEAAKAFEKLGQVLRQWEDATSSTLVKTEEEKKELYRNLAVGVEGVAEAFAEAERAARKKTVKAAKSQALEEARTFKKISATFDAAAVAFERYARVLEGRSRRREDGYDNEEQQEKRRGDPSVLSVLALLKAAMSAVGVSAEGTVAKAFEEASVIFMSLIDPVSEDSEIAVGGVSESAEGAARMFKEAAKEAISRTE